MSSININDFDLRQICEDSPYIEVPNVEINRTSSINFTLFTRIDSNQPTISVSFDVINNISTTVGS